MKQLRYLLKREFRLFFTNKTMLSVFFMAPAFYALLIGFTYKEGKVENIPVIVINHDKTPLSDQVTQMFEDNHTIKVLHYIDEPAPLKDEVIKTEAAAVVIIPERFEALMLQKKVSGKLRFTSIPPMSSPRNFATKSDSADPRKHFRQVQRSRRCREKGMNAENCEKLKYEPFKSQLTSTLFKHHEQLT